KPTAGGPKHSTQACCAASGNCAPQPRQTRWRAGEAVSVGASRADVMEAYLSSSQAGCPGLDGVGTCQARPRHRVVRGGCRGVVGPLPSAPLDEVFNLSTRVWDVCRSCNDRSHQVGQLTTSLRRTRYQAQPKKNAAYASAEITPLTMSSVCTGFDSSPSHALA